MASRYRQKRKSLIQTEGYNVTQQVCSSIIICASALLGFLPYMLNKKFHDEEGPSIPYSDGSDDVLIDITNAALVSCMTMMWFEALLDSNTLYLPIKIAFPRFLIVFGVLVISLSFYFQDFDEETDRLRYLTCMLFAKGYFICGGLTLKLVVDTIEQRSYQWIIYVAAAVLFTADFMLHQWAPYYPKSEIFTIVQVLVSVCSFCVSLFFLYKVAQLCISKNRNEEGSYDVMSHLVVCVFYFGTLIVDSCFPAETWKVTTATEIALYNFVGLFAIVLFFFTSSFIAQRHFVTAKVSILYFRFTHIS
jgi:hypothetical protein